MVIVSGSLILVSASRKRKSRGKFLAVSTPLIVAVSVHESLVTIGVMAIVHGFQVTAAKDLSPTSLAVDTKREIVPTALKARVLRGATVIASGLRIRAIALQEAVQMRTDLRKRKAYPWMP